MHPTKGRCWLALAMLGLAASAARAEWITPNSIPNPPAAVASANGTPVYAGNLVSGQYVGLGLGFSTWTAITHLNGIPVWAPVESIGTVPVVPPNYVRAHVNYYSFPGFVASLNSLTTRNPITVSSLTVETIGSPGFLSMHVYGRNGPYVPLNITPVVQSIPGTDNEKLWKFTGAGIWSFSISVVPPPGFGEPALVTNSPWGVAAVSFAEPPGYSPEPSSLVLAGLGVLGLAARLGWRRACRRIA